MVMRYKYIIEFVVYAGSVSMAIIFNAMGPMLPTLMEEFKITFTQAGLLSSIVPCILGVFALISGGVVGKLGLKVTSCLGLTVMSIGCILSGLADTYTEMLISRVVSAIGAGLFFPMMGAIIMQWFKDSELVVVNSINFSGSAVGGALVLVIAPTSVAALGWSNTLIGFGVGSGVIASLAWFLLKEPNLGVESKNQNTETGKGLNAAGIFRMKETWLLAFAFAAPVAVSVVIPTFLPSYFIQTQNMTMEVASNWVSTVFLIGIPAAIAGGLLGAKAGVRKPFLIASGLMLGIGVFATVLLTGISAIIGLILIGIGLLFYTGILFTIPMEIPNMTPETAGLMIGIITFVGMQCGFIAPLVVGWIESQTGSLKEGILFFGVFGLLMAVLPIFLDETGQAQDSLSQSERNIN
jgi:CP family cyanate transporter-like MFS transporter